MNCPADYDICPECGAVSYGNLFCNRCRNVNNDRYGWNLPPWPHKAMKPCGKEEVRAFIRKVESANIQAAIARIKNEVAEKHGIDEWYLSSNSRKAYIMSARREAMKRCKDETDATLEMIGKAFNRNHTTVHYTIYS